MRSPLIVPIVLTIIAHAAPAASGFLSAPVEYRHGEMVLEGYLARDPALAGKRPGVLVIRDWMGIGSLVREITDRLAAMGYVAFAIDMYGKGVRPSDTKEASALAAAYRKDRPLMRRRAAAGLGVLLADELADPAKVAVIGYCFGGGAALELACSGAPTARTVSFHGNLDTPQAKDAANIRGKVLVLHGADDPSVPPEQVAAFQNEMRSAGVDWQMNIYGGAVNAFANPYAGRDKSTGLAYDEKADRRS